MQHFSGNSIPTAGAASGMVPLAEFYLTMWRLFRQRSDNPLVRYHLARRGGAGEKLRIGVFAVPAIMVGLWMIVQSVESADNVSRIAILGYGVLLLLYVPLTFWMYRGNQLDPDRITALLQSAMTPDEIFFGHAWPIMRLQWIGGFLFFVLPLWSMILFWGWSIPVWRIVLMMITVGLGVSAFILTAQLLTLGVHFGAAANRTISSVLDTVIVSVCMVAISFIPILAGFDLLPVNRWWYQPEPGLHYFFVLAFFAVYFPLLVFGGWLFNWDYRQSVIMTARHVEFAAPGPVFFSAMMRKWKKSGWQDYPAADFLAPPNPLRLRLWIRGMVVGIASALVGVLVIMFGSVNRGSFDWEEFWVVSSICFLLGHPLGCLLIRRRAMNDAARWAQPIKQYWASERGLVYTTLIGVILQLIIFGWMAMRGIHISIVERLMTLLFVFIAVLVPALIHLVVVYSIWCSVHLTRLRWRLCEAGIIGLAWTVFFCMIGFEIYSGLFHEFVTSLAFATLIIGWIVLRVYASISLGRALYFKRATSSLPLPTFVDTK